MKRWKLVWRYSFGENPTEIPVRVKPNKSATRCTNINHVMLQSFAFVFALVATKSFPNPICSYAVRVES